MHSMFRYKIEVFVRSITDTKPKLNLNKTHFFYKQENQNPNQTKTLGFNKALLSKYLTKFNKLERV